MNDREVESTNATNGSSAKRWLVAAAALFIAAAACYFASAPTTVVGIVSTLAFVLLVVAARQSKQFKGLAFTAAVLACITCAIFFPGEMTSWAGEKPGKTIGPYVFAPLLQLIMFGMGMTLTFADFGRVVQTPTPVIIGFVLQFTVMPLMAVLCIKTFGLTGEIATGMILYGACSGGTASNVIVYLARGNVALSVTMTTCSTMAAPLMTPLAMELLGGAQLELDSVAMAWGIFKMVVAPVFIGLLINRFVHDKVGWLLRWLPLTAMIAICTIIGLTVAMAHDDLMRYGTVILAAAICHNASGLSLGYFAARLLRLDKTDCRTVAIEVGMQNGGMATALALNHLQSPTAALVSAIEGPWGGLTGSALAAWWGQGAPDIQQEEAV